MVPRFLRVSDLMISILFGPWTYTHTRTGPRSSKGRIPGAHPEISSRFPVGECAGDESLLYPAHFFVLVPTAVFRSVPKFKKSHASPLEHSFRHSCLSISSIIFVMFSLYFVVMSYRGHLRTRKALRASQQDARGPGRSFAEVALATPKVH